MIRRLNWRRLRPYRRHPSLSSEESDVFSRAWKKLDYNLPRHPRVERIKKQLEALRRDAYTTNSPSDWIAAFVVQAPRAVLAQRQMDAHPHGYHNKQARLYELIDFNDAFVATVLCLKAAERAVFIERVKELCDWMCERANTPKFSEEQWEAICRGLSREIALYLAAKNFGFDAVMTSRSQDALGIDMQVRDPESKRYINIDCKTPSSYRYRLEELVREGRLSFKEQMAADERGYTLETNGHGSERAHIVLLALLPERYGDVVEFRFAHETALHEIFNRLISEYGISDDRFGRFH